MKGEHFHTKIGQEIHDVLKLHAHEIDEDDVIFILIRVLYSQICAKKLIRGTDEDSMIKTVFDTLNIMHGENTR